MAAQDAELKLRVSLDLTSLRRQLNTVGTSLNGQPLYVPFKFDRKLIANEYRLLSRYIKGKTFDVKIESKTLENLSKKVKNFQERLKTLEGVNIEVGVGVVQSLSQRDARRIKSGLRTAVLGGSKKILVPTTITPKITGKDVDAFKAAVKEKLSGISVDVKANVKGKGFAGSPQGAAGLMEFMQSQGMIGKTASDMEMRMKKSSDDLSRDLDDAVKSAEKIKATFDGIAKSIATTGKTTANVQGKRLGLGNVPLMSGSIERRVERAASSIAGTLSSDVLRLLYPEINRAISSFTALRGQVQQNASKLSGFSLIIGLAAFAGVPLAKSVVKLTGSANDFAKLLDGLGPKLESAFLKAASNILNASSTRLLTGGRLAGLLSPAAGPAGLLPPAYRGIGPSRNAGALPPAYRGIGPAAGPVGLLPRYTSRSARDEMMRQLGAGEEGPGKLALTDEMVQRRSPIQAARVREIFDPREFEFGTLRLFRVIGDALEQAAAQAQEARIDRSIDELMRSIDDAIKVAQARVRIGAGLFTGRARVTDMGRSALPSVQPALPPARIAGLLPEAMGRAPNVYSEALTDRFARREREARMRSAQREMDVMGGSAIVPYTGGVTGGGGRDRVTGSGQPPQRGGAIVPYAPSSKLPSDYYKNALKYSEALKVADASMRNFSASQIPLIGGIKNLAGEFAQAAKQVLLYGTAYKGLAFITSLPGQVLNAAKSQQQYNNALQTATQDTGTYGKELLYVDNVQRAFGLDLETTRTGFTRLYASMGPTGFDSGSIEKLFTGISAATAALQLTPDKAERVIYAFGQMASKGQIMSEELKGQLGDVLPGALAIFAKAAGMSVKKFSKAMEDGEFVGNRFREVFAKVSDELMNRFGTGAQAAGKSMQGLINVVGGDFKRTLESFAPLANSAAQAILGPLGASLKQLSMSAQIATGEIERTFTQLQQAQKDLGELKTTPGVDAKEIKAAEQNVAALTVRYETLNRAAQDPAINKQVQDLQKFTEELTKAGTFVLNLANSIGSVLSPILNFFGSNLTTTISLVTSLYLGFQAMRLATLAVMGALLLLKTVSAALGLGQAAISANALSGAFGVLGIQASGASIKVIGLTTALRVLAGATVIGFVVTGISLIAGAFATMRDRAKEASEASREAAKSAIEAASTGSVAQASMAVQNILAEGRADAAALRTLQGIRARATKEQKAGVTPTGLTIEEAVALQGSKLTAGIVAGGVTRGGRREIRVPSGQEMTALKAQFGRVAGERKVALGEAKTAETQAAETAKRLGLNIPTPGTLPPESAGEDSAAKAAADKAAADAARLASQQQQNAIDAANRQNAIDKSRFDGLTALSDQAFQHEINLIDARNNYELAGLDSIASRQEKFQQDLQKIELDRIDTVRQATQKAVEASLKFATAQNTAVAAGTGRVQGGGTGLFQGSTGISSGPHFDVRRADGGRISEAEARALFSEEVRRQLTMTSGYGPRRAPAPGASTFHRGIDLAGPVNTPLSLAPGYSLMGVGQEGGLGYAASVQGPQGQSYKVGHLQKPGAGYTMQRREAKAGGNLQVEQLERSNALEEASLVAINATTEALAKREALIASNINTIFPVAEQRLQNDLTKIRNDLQLKGMPQEYIDYQEESYKASYEMSEAIKKNEEETKKYQKSVDALQGKQAKGIALTADETSALTFYTGAIAQNKEALSDLAKQQVEYNIVALEGAIAALKNADALKAQQETMDLIKSSVESASNSYKGFMKEVIMGGDPKEALKKFQEAITDQVVTIFLDFAMKPVEDMLKNQLSALFGVKTEEQAREEVIKNLEDQLQELEDSKKELENSAKTQERIDKNVELIANGISGAGQNQFADAASALPKGFGMSTSLGSAINAADYSSVFKEGSQALTASLTGVFADLSSALDASAYSLSESAVDYSDTFKDISDNAEDMAKKTGEAAEEAGKNGKDMEEALGKTAAGIGIAAGAIMGIAAGLSQIKKGGTANVLGGIGSILLGVGGAIGGYAKLFAANGAVWKGGFQAFANGGTVTGPTLGLVGEGKYNEAIVPLPDGRSIPVQMRGGSSRDLLNAPGSASAAPTMLSMSFQSTTINGVEYVDRAQLEAAMAETRKSAARDGASRGASLALDRLQNSPSTRRRVGIR